MPYHKHTNNNRYFYHIHHINDVSTGGPLNQRMLSLADEILNLHAPHDLQKEKKLMRKREMLQVSAVLYFGLGRFLYGTVV